MIGYEMGFFHRPRFILWPRLRQWRTSRMDVKMTWLTNLTTLFAKGSSPEAKFLGQPQILGQEP